MERNSENLMHSNNKKPINIIEEDIRTINRNLNTLIIDIQNIKSDIKEIKQLFKQYNNKKNLDKEDISKGWWFS